MVFNATFNNISPISWWLLIFEYISHMSCIQQRMRIALI